MTPILSPCQSVCAVDGQTGLCLGCGRTLKEIGSWTKMTPEERRDVMKELASRMDRLKALGKLGPTP
ncbi:MULTISPECIES: DUF1289 domain-containing protein [Henriciella]|jgi:predicted Fe-S protein YdhL (DUF1289 family)|uniref:DUF1289 domain-containing protein n=1 Tax=Henriciella pelagia TaxID=1977912 RepID=A0ABQ1K1J0_9PROT|nr:DUF1289 domain-containing protein [Henriciella pelagia]GGB80275.1 hypothetical protein GCM10011503_31280 [Henriciella pelagia]